MCKRRYICACFFHTVPYNRNVLLRGSRIDFFLAKFSVSLEIISEEQLHTYTLPSYSQLSDNNIFLLDGLPADTNGATNSTSSRIESQTWVLSRS